MSKDLQGKVALVTGGGRDIGRAIVLELAGRGASVVVNYRGDEAAARATVADAEAMGVGALAVAADVTRPEAVAALVEQARAAFGDTIDLLVNNAGGLVARKKMEEMDEAFWHQVLDLNLGSAFRVTKAVLPHMPDGSAIVNVSSLAAHDGGGPGAIAYASAKGGLLTFTRGLAKELGPRRIRVNAVAPGLIATTFHDVFSKPEGRAMVASRTVLAREGRAEEVGRAIGFLLSDAASFVTGECLELNGGLYFA